MQLHLKLHRDYLVDFQTQITKIIQIFIPILLLLKSYPKVFKIDTIKQSYLILQNLNL
jgi:hypothetical protein